MNDKQKRLVVIGTGAAVISAYALSRKKSGGDGGGGSIFGSTGDGLSMPGDGGAGTPTPDPASTIADILSSLPVVSTYSGGGFGTPSPAAAMAGIPQVMSTGGGGVTTKKESFSLSSIVTGATPVMQAGAWSVMFPVQTLGRASATIANAALSYVTAPEDLAIIHKKQAENVIKYPRTASAVSMLTGGATATAPITKKQQEARESHPTIYNAWKTLFSWAGA